MADLSDETLVRPAITHLCSQADLAARALEDEVMAYRNRDGVEMEPQDRMKVVSAIDTLKRVLVQVPQ